MTDLLRYWRTARYLTPDQVRHQIGLRLRAAFPSRPPAAPPVELEVRRDWGLGTERAPSTPQAGALEGRFQFWGREHRLDLRQPWIVAGEGKSWNYMVHYFDHVPGLATAARDRQDTSLRDVLCEHLATWIAVHPAGRGVAWEPYPTALRIVNWLDVVRILGPWSDAQWRESVLRSVYVQAAWLERHLERHLSGTHLFKDAKALAFAARVFGDRRSAGWAHIAASLVRSELSRHLRADGGHVEPSVLYHGIAFEDVLDLLNLHAGDDGASWREVLRSAAVSMLDYLQAVRPPGGGYPLLGDSAVDARPSPDELIAYAHRLGVEAPESGPGMRFLAPSGMLVWRSAEQYLLADVGGVGPPHLPGHGHCDSLSFEWHAGGLPFLVDSGTQTYEHGIARQASRSTRAHNTLEIDGREQHEMWAAFRVARRSTVSARLEDVAALAAELVPWFDRRMRVCRRFEFDARSVRCHDRVEGPRVHAVTSRLHLHPECEARLDANVLRLRRGAVQAEVRVRAEANLEIVGPDRAASVYCARFGVAVPNAELRIHYTGPLPWECQIEMRVTE
jgi:uncharacterized heparinase superfamily protein